MQLLFRTECVKHMVTVMKLFWFVSVTIILSRKVSNQTFVAFYVFNAIFITSRRFFEKLWDTIAADSGNEWVLCDFIERNSLVLIDSEAFSDKIFKIFRKVFQERDAIFHDLNFELFFGGTIPGYFSMDHFIDNDTHGPDIVFNRVDV